MSINTNLSALDAYRNLSKTSSSLNDSIQKLSSGLRINKAADDAAGLAISESLKSQTGGLQVAARNAQDGINVVQTAEGALGESQSILQRLRDLAVQAGNDSNNTQARQNIKTESDQLVKELGRIANTTNFNGTKLLDGSADLKFQVGANGTADDTIEVNLNQANLKAIATSLTGSGAGASFNVLTPTAVAGTATFTVGAAGSSSTINVALGAAGSYTSVQGVADKLNGDASFSSKLTATVNDQNQLVVTSNDGSAVVGGATAGTDASAGTGFGTSASTTGGGLDFSSNAAAQASITLLDSKISSISTARAQIGAYQNRFTHTINNINVAVENLSASQSQITDTDMASEMVNFTRSQILQQAGTAMLAQANQAPQSILKLLG
ncbi:flagellin N-terminal helical domain-containing protein [Pseudolysinimonas sp.]|uniref:flagellin N-terminal helical domain-containing protein n=1 Tax=Pseudolysinimonas sp. TaxID=2680009 RepID=UPI003F8195EB